MSFLARSAKTTARTFRVQARGVHHTEITTIAGGMPSVKGTTHAHSDLSVSCTRTAPLYFANSLSDHVYFITTFVLSHNAMLFYL